MYFKHKHFLMPRFRNRNGNGNGNRNQGQQFPAQDDVNSIPYYNSRLFAMYESLIQSFTHFTYHSNHMYHVLERALHGTQNSINSSPYPWLFIPHQRQQQQQQPRVKILNFKVNFNMIKIK